jgi:amino-acid N-acetyltransferase
MRIERATTDDLPEIERLLASTDLPLDGVAGAFTTGVVARDAGHIVGVAAVEPYGRAGLLRSVAVAPERRGEGLGRTLVEATEALASGLAVDELYLLTETAVEWFPRLGYRPVDRAAIPALVKASIEFTTACGETAVAMTRRLPG